MVCVNVRRLILMTYWCSVIECFFFVCVLRLLLSFVGCMKLSLCTCVCVFMIGLLNFNLFMAYWFVCVCACVGVRAGRVQLFILFCGGVSCV